MEKLCTRSIEEALMGDATQNPKTTEQPSQSETEHVSDTTSDSKKTTPEVGGPKGLEPTRYGDWERKGRCVDF